MQGDKKRQATTHPTGIQKTAQINYKDNLHDY